MAKPPLVFASVGFAVAAFIVAVSLGTAITATTGIPLAGGLLNGVLTAMVLTIGLLATRFAGAATVMWVVFALLASFTTTLGPPGIYKVVIGAIAGILWDLIYQVSGRRKWGLYVGAVVGALSIMLTLIAALRLGFGANAAEALQKYTSALGILLGINLVVTVIGVFLGERVYQARLRELPAFQNLQRYGD
jgi:hypothetical protein